MHSLRDLQMPGGILLDHYGPDEMARRVFLIHSVKEVRDRWKFVDLALEDYRAERYHAVVPILLMVIDGATNCLTIPILGRCARTQLL